MGGPPTGAPTLHAPAPVVASAPATARHQLAFPDTEGAPLGSPLLSSDKAGRSSSPLLKPDSNACDQTAINVAG